MFAEEHVTVSQIADAYFSMYPELYHDSNVYFILDEIEMLHSWGAGISGLLDSHPANVLITGSSGKMLSHDIGTELRGRCLEYPFFPLSFKEFIEFNGVEMDPSEPVLSKRTEAEVQKLYDLFLERGAFPEVATIEDSELRSRIFSSYFDAMYSRDIMERYEVGKGAALRAFMRRIFRTSGQPQMTGRIENTMKSLGYPLSRPTIQDYLNMMMNAAIISEVPIYGTEKKAEYFPKKYYAVDHAFASIFTPYSAMTGVKAEHAVHAAVLENIPEQLQRVLPAAERGGYGAFHLLILLVDAAGVAARHSAVCLGEGPVQLFVHIRRDQVIRVHKADVLPPGTPNAVLARFAHAGIGLADELDARITRAKLPDDVLGRIGGAVIDAEYLDVMQRLGAEAGKTLRQITRRVVDRNDDRNKGTGGVFHAAVIL